MIVLFRIREVSGAGAISLTESFTAEILSSNCFSLVNIRSKHYLRLALSDFRWSGSIGTIARLFNAIVLLVTGFLICPKCHTTRPSIPAGYFPRVDLCVSTLLVKRLNLKFAPFFIPNNPVPSFSGTPPPPLPINPPTALTA